VTGIRILTQAEDISLRDHV